MWYMKSARLDNAAGSSHHGPGERQMELIEIPLRRLGAPGAPSPWANTPRFAWRGRPSSMRCTDDSSCAGVCRPAQRMTSTRDGMPTRPLVCTASGSFARGDFGPLIWDGKARRREDLYRDMNLFRAGYREPEPVGCYELRLMVSLTDQVRGLDRGLHRASATAL